MYNSPPPKDSLNWPFGLVMEVCLKIGLGKPESEWGGPSWTVAEIKEYSNLKGTSDLLRKYRNGHSGINTQRLDDLVNMFTTRQKVYGNLWGLIIRNSVNYKAKADLLKSERVKYFDLDTGETQTQTLNPEITAYLDKAETYQSLEQIHDDIGKTRLRPKTPYPTSNTGLLSRIKDIYRKNKTLTLALSGVVIILIFVSLMMAWVKYEIANAYWDTLGDKRFDFKNIVFCAEEDFDHDLNKCLRSSSNFKHGIKKVNISFESTVLPIGTRFYLHWYRYGEKFIVSKKFWTETFARDLRYASTFIRDNKGLQSGKYSVRFFAKKSLFDNFPVGEAIFYIYED